MTVYTIRCPYCTETLETRKVDYQTEECLNCGLLYAVELLEQPEVIDVIDNPRYEILRIEGHPPQVTITDLQPQRLVSQ